MRYISGTVQQAETFRKYHLENRHKPWTKNALSKSYNPKTGKKKNNYWVVYKHGSWVEWWITFAHPTTHLETNKLIQFSDRLLTLGKETGVYDLVETAEPYAWQATSGITYKQFISQILEKTGRLLLTSPGTGYVVPGKGGGKLTTRTRLCYYRNGRKVEETVENLGALLRELRPDSTAQKVLDYARDVAPLVIKGSIELTDQPVEKRLGLPHIVISLSSDIWYPFVIGWLEEFPASLQEGRMWDNHELAQCHTPRLNHFLAEVRELTLSFGGQWTLENHPYRPYRPQTTETGIDLDFDPFAWWEAYEGE